MSNDYIPKKEDLYQDWLENFASVVSTHVQELGLTTQQVTDIGNDSTLITTSLRDIASLRDTLGGKIETKDNDIKATKARIRKIVTQIQGNPNVTVILKRQLRLNTHETPRTNTPPVTPLGLQAEPFINGTNLLTWKAGDNKPNTRYVIEYRVGNTGAYSYLANTTATKYSHTGQTLGVLVWYRVRAERRKLASDWTEGESVYGGKEESETTVRVAA
jgi:hypothetical protein